MDKIRVFDNGGETLDRYTAIVDGSFIGLSDRPYHPLGFCQYCGEVGAMKDFSHLGKEVELATLPGRVQKAIEGYIYEA